MDKRKVFSKFNFDKTVKSPTTCHCEERNDEAIQENQALKKHEIGSLRSQWPLWGLFTRPSIFHFAFHLLH
jgi:hypothetical protein